MAAAPGERLPLYPEPLHNFQVATPPTNFYLKWIKFNVTDHTSIVSAGSPLPRDCAGRAQL